MFELLILAYFFIPKKFKIKIYKHQKMAIFSNFIIPSITKLISMHLSLHDDGNCDGNIKYKYKSNNECNLLKDIYVVHKWMIPIGIIIYIGLLILRSWIYTEIKWFMDIEYTPHNKILSYSC